MKHLPNSDPQAEATCLSMALLVPEAQDELADALGEQDFTNEAHRAIWRGLRGIRAEGGRADLVSIPAWLRRNGVPVDLVPGEFLVSLCSCTPAVANVEQHARSVSALGKVRRVQAQLQALAAEGRAEVDPETWVDSVAARVAEIAQDGSDGGQDAPEFLGDVASRVTKAITGRIGSGNAPAGTRTGIHAWDEHVMGLQPGKVYVIAGRPGTGKTVFLTQSALGIARDAGSPGVGVFSLEMTREELALRMLSQSSGVGHRDMQQGKLSQQDWGNVNASQALFKKFAIVMDDRMNLNAENLAGRARRLGVQLARRGNPMRVVGIDYLQLIQGNRRAGNREQEVAQVSRACKALAKELGVAVLLLSQLSRPEKGKEGARPRLSDLRESGAIEQDADVVTFTHAPAPDTRELVVSKGRHCGTAIIEIGWDGEHVRFQEPRATADNWDGMNG